MKQLIDYLLSKLGKKIISFKKKFAKKEFIVKIVHRRLFGICYNDKRTNVCFIIYKLLIIVFLHRDRELCC